jgi:hypothetical protein
MRAFLKASSIRQAICLSLICVSATAFILGVGPRAISYHEEKIVIPTVWSYCWDENCVGKIVESARSVWVTISYEIHYGRKTSNGSGMIYSDTLVCTVSGPRADVERATERLTSLLR